MLRTIEKTILEQFPISPGTFYSTELKHENVVHTGATWRYIQLINIERNHCRKTGENFVKFHGNIIHKEVATPIAFPYKESTFSSTKWKKTISKFEKWLKSSAKSWREVKAWKRISTVPNIFLCSLLGLFLPTFQKNESFYRKRRAIWFEVIILRYSCASLLKKIHHFRWKRPSRSFSAECFK